MLLGIDIGGTTISFGLVEGKEIVKKICVPSFPPAASLEETLAYLSGHIKEMLTPQVSHIGIGVPTLVDIQKGIVYDALNIPSWREVHLKEYLEKRFGIPVSVNNDANCYALGAAARVGLKEGTLVCVTMGTGTGIGIVTDGRLFCGDHCGAGELCSLLYQDSICEAYCSKQFFENRGHDCKAASQAAMAGDLEALDLFREYGTHVGRILAMVLYAYDPSVLVLGGGVAYTYPLFQDAMERSLRESYLYPHVLDTLRIQAMPEADTALLGASLL